MGEEQLLQRWLSAEQLLDMTTRESAQERFDRSGDVAPHRVVVQLEHGHTGNPREVWRCGVEGGLDGER